MKQIDWIFFDVGGILIDEKYSYQRHFRLCEEKLRDNSIQIVKDSYGKLIKKGYKKYKTTSIYSLEKF